MGDRTIDLSADVGESPSSEGRSLDAALIEQVSTAHIACGGHAGDAASMAAAIDACLATQTRVGAHPSYEDREGFGRRPTDSSPRAVAESVIDQVRALREIATRSGTDVLSVKPHGQLYHDLAADPDLRAAVLGALATLDPVPLVVLAAAAPSRPLPQPPGVRIVAEGFIDRRYDSSGQLVARSEPGALLIDPEAAASQAARLAAEGIRVDGIRVPIVTLCVHSDSPGALGSLLRARASLEGVGFSIAPVRR